MSEPRQGNRRTAAIVIALLSFTLSACGSGEGTPVSGPDKASCTSAYPPENVRLPADTCGVKPLHFPSNPHNPNIPRDAKAGTIQLDLYIEGDHTCGLGNSLCAVDDNRPFVPVGSADPQADPTRNRVHMVLDFASQSIRVQISPSCRIHVVDLPPPVGPAGLNPSKECFAPNQIGEGTDLSLRSSAPGTVEVKLNVLQTAYYASPAKLGQIENTFVFTPHSEGSVDFSVHGTNFPDLAVIRDGKVVCADQATHITAAVLPAIGPNERSYDCQLSPIASQTSGAIDGCLVGSWKSTGLTTVGQLKLAGGAGELLTVDADGTYFYDYSQMQPYSGTTAGGDQIEDTITGTLTGQFHTRDGTWTTSVDDPSTMELSIRKNGVLVATGHASGSDSGSYTCQPHRHLTISDSTGVIEFEPYEGR